MSSSSNAARGGGKERIVRAAAATTNDERWRSITFSTLYSVPLFFYRVIDRVFVVCSSETTTGNVSIDNNETKTTNRGDKCHIRL